MNRIFLQYTKEEIKRLLKTGLSVTVRGDTEITISIPSMRRVSIRAELEAKTL